MNAPKTARQTGCRPAEPPPLPQAKPELLGAVVRSICSACRMRFKREIDKGTIPGRDGGWWAPFAARIGWFDALGRQKSRCLCPDGAQLDLPHLLDDKKPIVSVGRHDAAGGRPFFSCSTIRSRKYIPEFSDQKVGV